MRVGFLFVVLVSYQTLFGFDLGAMAKDVLGGDKKSSVDRSHISLDNATITSGLKEALSVGVEYATKELGAKNGYLDNSLVKINLPKSLSKAESVIRGLGGDKYVDNFVESMNSAASDAAPHTVDIFLKAISDMSLDDAKKILVGDDNAATEYFKSTTTRSLSKLIRPIVKKTMDTNNVTKYYEEVNGFYKSDIKSMATEYGLGSFISTDKDKDLDDYVTDEAIDGLFKIIAEKEKEIREDPVAQTTTLLKQVFGL